MGGRQTKRREMEAGCRVAVVAAAPGEVRGRALLSSQMDAWLTSARPRDAAAAETAETRATGHEIQIDESCAATRFQSLRPHRGSMPAPSPTNQSARRPGQERRLQDIDSLSLARPSDAAGGSCNLVWRASHPDPAF